jgi:hypothetical protein
VLESEVEEPEVEEQEVQRRVQVVTEMSELWEEQVLLEMEGLSAAVLQVVE